MQEFAGKVAVITGAASGIGKALATHCAHLRMKLVLADVAEQKLRQCGADLEAAGADALCVPTDVASRASVEALAQRTVERFGGVHLLFNNAGVAAGGVPWEATWNDWEWVTGVNLWGVIHGVKIFTPIMLEQKVPCHIVNTASAAGLTVGGLSAPYSVTKHAVVALSESLYLSLQQRLAGIGVSVLCPGMVNTGIDSAERNRPTELKNPEVPLSPQLEAGRAAFQALLAASMDPTLVADATFAGIREERFYILTHPEWQEVVELRTSRLNRLENPVSPMPVILRIVQPRGSA